MIGYRAMLQPVRVNEVSGLRVQALSTDLRHLARAVQYIKCASIGGSE